MTYVGRALLGPLESLSHFWLSLLSLCALLLPASAPVTGCGGYSQGQEPSCPPDSPSPSLLHRARRNPLSLPCSEAGHPLQLLSQGPAQDQAEAPKGSLPETTSCCLLPPFLSCSLTLSCWCLLRAPTE